MRVVYGRGGPGLRDEAPPELVVRRHRRGQELQRYSPAKAFVAGTEHHGHSAGSDLRLQAVSGHQRANAEPGQRWEILAQLPSPPSSPRRAAISVIEMIGWQAPLRPV